MAPPLPKTEALSEIPRCVDSGYDGKYSSILYEEFGGSEALRLAEIEEPSVHPATSG
ncbi:hypothetical protein ACPESV_46625 [Streptomyces umbrinus]|uniref:hypothetical protein n=1 Tax=Streptomyces umbrinus TaxID=67370 RepID=UPI003C2BEA3F